MDGVKNERICATTLYCYSYENISDASISFEHRCYSKDLISLNSLTKTTKVTEDDNEVKDLQPAVQEQGSILIQEGRVINFSNVGE